MDQAGRESNMHPLAIIGIIAGIVLVVGGALFVYSCCYVSGEPNHQFHQVQDDNEGHTGNIWSL
jgi:hypothetical protein